MSNLARGWGHSLIQQSTAVVMDPGLRRDDESNLNSRRATSPPNQRRRTAKDRRPAFIRAPSRRAPHPGVEMRQPRHHSLLQQPQRVVPGLRLVLVVEAKHQQRAKTADLAIDLFDFFG